MNLNKESELTPIDKSTKKSEEKNVCGCGCMNCDVKTADTESKK